MGKLLATTDDKVAVMATRGPDAGRTKRLTLADKYPGFPFAEGEEITDPLDKKFLYTVRALEGVIEEFLEKGWIDSVRDFARKAGVSNSVLISTRSGSGYPDGVTIAKIENATQRPIWKHQHKLRPDICPVAVRDEPL